MNFGGGTGKEEGGGRGSHPCPRDFPMFLTPRLVGAAEPPVLGLHLGPKHSDAASAPHLGA